MDRGLEWSLRLGRSLCFPLKGRAVVIPQNAVDEKSLARYAGRVKGISWTFHKR